MIPCTTVRVIGDRPHEGLTDDAVMSFLRPDGTADAAVRFMLTHPAGSRACSVSAGTPPWPPQRPLG